MPIILLGRVPLPRLTTYVAGSVLLFVCSAYYWRLDVGEVIKPTAVESDIQQSSRVDNDYQQLLVRDDSVPLQNLARNLSTDQGLFDDLKAVRYVVSKA